MNSACIVRNFRDKSGFFDNLVERLGNYIWVAATTSDDKNYLNQQLKQLKTNNYRARQHALAMKYSYRFYTLAARDVGKRQGNTIERS